MSTNKLSLLFVFFAAITILPCELPFAQVANANDGYAAQSYADYRGGRPQVQYRYPYRYPRRAYRSRVYYYAPAYRYPAYVYPRTPNMMYYGPSVRVTYGPWGYAY